MESSNYFDIFFQWSVASRNYPISMFVSMLRVLQQRQVTRKCNKKKPSQSMQRRKKVIFSVV